MSLVVKQKSDQNLQEPQVPTMFPKTLAYKPRFHKNILKQVILLKIVGRERRGLGARRKSRNVIKSASRMLGGNGNTSYYNCVLTTVFFVKIHYATKLFHREVPTSS